jgi:hypothetical protein
MLKPLVDRCFCNAARTDRLLTDKLQNIKWAFLHHCSNQPYAYHSPNNTWHYVSCKKGRDEEKGIVSDKLLAGDKLTPQLLRHYTTR